MSARKKTIKGKQTKVKTADMESHSYNDEAISIEEPKKVPLTFQIIVNRNLPVEATRGPQENVVSELNKITHLRLDRENIRLIDNLELLGSSLTNLYLQHNFIERIENLECLPNLRFLTLASNKIRVIEGLSHLKMLGFLDLSDNLIQTFDIDELPQSLVILNLKNNPCTYISDHRGRIIQDLPKLKQLDEEEVTKTEKRETGYVVSSDTDEDDDDEEEEEEEEEEEDGENDIKDKGIPVAYHTIRDMLASAASDILLRSQDRLEAEFQEHMKTMDQLDGIREECELPPSSARSTARSTGQPGQPEGATGPLPKHLRTKKDRARREMAYEYDSDST